MQLISSASFRKQPRRILLSQRTALKTVQDVIDALKKNPRQSHKGVAAQCGIGRTVVSNISKLLTASPDLLDRVLTDELSIGDALEELKQHNGTSPEPRPISVHSEFDPELLREFHAWADLTIEFLQSIKQRLPCEDE